MNKKKRTAQAVIMLMMAMASFSAAGCQTKGNGANNDSTKTDSTQVAATQEGDALVPDTREIGDGREFIFAEYQGKKWTVKDDGENAAISCGDKTFTLTGVNLGTEDLPHYVLNVLDARIYKGKIWLIAYDDVAGRRAETEGTMFLYFDIATGKPHYVKSCSDASFSGKSISYKEMTLKKRGASRIEDEYGETNRTYNFDDIAKDEQVAKLVKRMFDEKLFFNDTFIRQHCTKKLAKKIAAADCDDPNVFLSGAQDGPSNKTAIIDVTPMGDSWYKYSFYDMGNNCENKIKVVEEGGEIKLDEVVRLRIE